MSDNGSSGLDFGQDEGTPSQAAPQQTELASGFLSAIPESDRAVVGKYIQDWDRGVQRRFQEIHDTYRPYKDIGVDYPTLVQATQVFQLLNDDPRTVYNNLKEFFDEQDAAEQQQNKAQDGKFAGLPDDFVSEYKQMQQLLLQMGQGFVQNQQVTQEAQEDAQLDTYMNQLKSQFGDFDETYVLAQMSTGMDGPDAVAAYQRFVTTVSSTPRPIVRPINGGGAVSSGQFDPRKADGQSVRNAVAQMLAQAKAQEQ